MRKRLDSQMTPGERAAAIEAGTAFEATRKPTTHLFTFRLFGSDGPRMKWLGARMGLSVSGVLRALVKREALALGYQEPTESPEP